MGVCVEFQIPASFSQLTKKKSKSGQSRINEIKWRMFEIIILHNSTACFVFYRNAFKHTGTFYVSGKMISGELHWLMLFPHIIWFCFKELRPSEKQATCLNMNANIYIYFLKNLRFYSVCKAETWNHNH